MGEVMIAIALLCQAQELVQHRLSCQEYYSECVQETQTLRSCTPTTALRMCVGKYMEHIKQKEKEGK